LEAAQRPHPAQPVRHARQVTARSWPTAEPGWRAHVALVTPTAQRDPPLEVSRTERAAAQQSWPLATAARGPGLPSARPKLGWLAAPAVQSLPWAPLTGRAPLEGCLPTAQLCWQHYCLELHSSRQGFALKSQPQRRRTRLDCLGHAPGPGRTRGGHAFPRGWSKSPPPETLRAAGTDPLRRRTAGPAIHVPIFASRRSLINLQTAKSM